MLPVCECDCRSCRRRGFGRNKDMRVCKGERRQARAAERIRIQIGENRRTPFFYQSRNGQIYFIYNEQMVLEPRPMSALPTHAMHTADIDGEAL